MNNYSNNNDRLTAAEERALFEHIDDPKAREKIIECNLKLATWCASKHKGEMDWDDLIQEAIIALIRAVDTYDPDRGARFSTYAVTVISRALKKVVYADGLIRYPLTAAKAQIVSGDAPLSDETTDTLLDTIPAEEPLHRAKETAAVEYAMSLLDEREQAVLRRLYLERDRGSAKDLAEELGISAAYVYLIRDNALRKLRDPDTIDVLRKIAGAAL